MSAVDFADNMLSAIGSGVSSLPRIGLIQLKNSLQIHFTYIEQFVDTYFAD